MFYQVLRGELGHVIDDRRKVGWPVQRHVLQGSEVSLEGNKEQGFEHISRSSLHCLFSVFFMPLSYNGVYFRFGFLNMMFNLPPPPYFTSWKRSGDDV